jgi:3',5'-cyclic AMP phosphodiesterase CpdA
MKRFLFYFLLTFSFLQVCSAENFKFAFLTDLHIQIKNNQPAIDLENAIREVNADTTIRFALIGGDITESGDIASMKKAGGILAKLKIPYYVIPGNHDTMLNDTGLVNFQKVFGYQHFSFRYKGYQFVGFNTGPMKGSHYGHVSAEELTWVENVQKEIPETLPVFAVTHYPLLTGDVDNWLEITSALRKYNIMAVLNGHYHRNAIFSYDGLPGIVNRSTLSSDKDKGGYSIYTVSDRLVVTEKKIGEEPIIWLEFPIGTKENESHD